MEKQVKKEAKEIFFKILVASLFFLVAIFIFGLIAHEVVGENEDWFDTKAFQFLQPLTNSNLVSLAKTFSFFGSHYFLIPAYVFIVILLFLIKKEPLQLR